MSAVHQSYEDKSPSAAIHFTRTIDRKFVHRQAINEVFITSLHYLEDDHFMISAILPKSHMYFNDHPAMANGKHYYDASLLLEVFRQTSICVTHKFYGVPFSAKFIFNDAKFTILNLQPLEISQALSLAVVDVRIVNPKCRKNTLTGYTLDMTLYIDDIICAEKTMCIGWMEASVWKKLRSKKGNQVRFNYADSKPASYLSVGRMIPRNVVISDPTISNGCLMTSLIVDQSYSSIFDHPLDHVPGMFIIEAFRQTALLAASASQNTPAERLFFYGCNISFQQFCELDSTSHCIVNLDEMNFINDLIQIPVSILQDNVKNTTGAITLKIIS